MAEIIRINSAHPLVGTWVAEEEDTAAEYTIRPEKDGFSVSGIDVNDGEIFQITDVVWDGQVLRFTSYMASTGYRAKHALQMSQNKDRHIHELTIYEIWKRKRSPK